MMTCKLCMQRCICNETIQRNPNTPIQGSWFLSTPTPRPSSTGFRICNQASTYLPHLHPIFTHWRCYLVSVCTFFLCQIVPLIFRVAFPALISVFCPSWFLTFACLFPTSSLACL
ncbi:hypothetical protein ANANG_G00138690 [Anguilla anguilla]|uniref:Uncharacterized protein n=1 Tax=Anguilla anguilla TaxID=7936 RepID=A0A9D3MCB0_ANGAN|nr:hypothetical protein ANANG_G00138690 [Anguilla anguilla]